MRQPEPVERSYDTLIACPQCRAAVNASLEVERAVLDVLTRIAVSDAWKGVSAPRLEGTLTRLVQDYEERVQMRLTREPLCTQPLAVRTHGDAVPVPRMRTRSTARGRKRA